MKVFNRAPKLPSGRIPMLPYGYRYVDNKVVIVEKEAQIIKEAFELFSKGDMTAYTLNLYLRNKYPEITNLAFIDKKLTYSFYAGFIRFKDEIEDHPWPTIISKEIFEKCQVVLINNKNRFKSPQNEDLLFKGLVLCAYEGCPRFLYGNLRTDRIIKRLSTHFPVEYACNNILIHKTYSVSQNVLRDRIIDVLKDIDVYKPQGKILKNIHDHIKYICNNAHILMHHKNQIAVRNLLNFIFMDLRAYKETFIFKFHEPFKSIFEGKPYDTYSFGLSEIKKIINDFESNINPDENMSLEDRVIYLCKTPCSIDDILSNINDSNSVEISSVIFDLQLDGKIEVDSFGRYKTIG